MPQPLDRCDAADDLGGQFGLRRRRGAEGQAVGRDPLDGFDDRGVGVAEDHRPPGAHQVDVSVAVGVGQPVALRGGDEPRGAADGGEGPHRRVHPTGDDGSTRRRTASPKPRLMCSARMATSVPAGPDASTTGCSGLALRGEREHRVVGVGGQLPPVPLDDLARQGRYAAMIGPRSCDRDLAGDVLRVADHDVGIGADVLHPFGLAAGGHEVLAPRRPRARPPGSAAVACSCAWSRSVFRCRRRRSPSRSC